jgi:hypothetical protein
VNLDVVAHEAVPIIFNDVDIGLRKPMNNTLLTLIDAMKV